MIDTYVDTNEKEAMASIPEPLKIIGAPFLDSVVDWFAFPNSHCDIDPRILATDFHLFTLPEIWLLL